MGLFALGVVLTLFMINWERKVVARMQQRPGPNRVGPKGWLQSLADGLKLAFKEDIMPVAADKKVYFIAPVISTIPAFVAFSVIPFGGEVSIFGEPTVLQLVDLPVGVLVVLACSSIGVYGIVLGGWASGSPYPLLAALRSAAQVISYEIALGLSVVAVILYAGSLSTADIVGAQASGWFGWLLIPSFAVFVIAMVGETNRRPVRPARGRVRAGRRLPHRVLVAEVRAVLPRRVRQHGHGLRDGHHAVPRRRAVARGRCRSSTATAGCSSWPSWSRRSSSCSSSSGCAARCPASATTSSCAWAGRPWCR